MTHKIAFSTMALDNKIESGDSIWPKFNASFVNQEVEMIDIANAIYMGHPFTTWHKNKWRESSNFLAGGYIGLDFDTGDERSSIDYLIKDDFIQKYAALIYTTPSHTAAKPKGRALFLLDGAIQQGSNYTRSVMALMWLFSGTTTPDRKCKDPCRFFYGSKNCQIEIIDNVLPLELVQYLISQYEVTGSDHKQQVEKRDYKPSTVTEQEIQSALNAIQAWNIDYDEWLHVLMGIHHQLGDTGLSIAESWAQGFDGEVTRLWKHLKNNGNTTGTRTIKSLFKLAYNRGWQGFKQGQGN